MTEGEGKALRVCQGGLWLLVVGLVLLAVVCGRCEVLCGCVGSWVVVMAKLDRWQDVDVDWWLSWFWGRWVWWAGGDTY